MNDFLWQTYHRLIRELDIVNKRYIYDQLNLEHRLTGLIGPRGIGKTTLMLQYIKNELYDSNAVFYFSADNTFFNETSILSFVDEMYQQHNIKIFFIDEIHKYPNWNQELKNIYDSFPKVKIVFSGSSSIDLVHGSYDLSRRARLMTIPGLSFREYLNIKLNQNFPAIDFKELLANHQKLASQYSEVTTILKHFEEYCLFGYYPIVFDSRDNLYDALSSVIEKTIYEDIAKFYNVNTANLNHFKRILNFLASMPPGKVKTNNVAKHLQIDNKTADHYLMILERSGLVRFLHPQARGNQLLTKPAKVFLSNTTLLAALNTILAYPLDIGTQRELAFMQMLEGADEKVYFAQVGDFIVDNAVFEVGGSNKTWKQLQNHHGDKYLVKDNILYGLNQQIPLYLFGFLY